MGSTPLATGFSEALELIARNQPPGFEFILDNEGELLGEYVSGQEEGVSSPYYLGHHQFGTNYVYQGLMKIAKLSLDNGKFTRPCCSTTPLIWPFCRKSC